ncbi:MAG: Ig-like domain-containing protein, partial [Oscillospiraceae bacterium]|nr:Ig-like domain-containing protein [Oscillospiraceae bacterium]
MKRFLKLHSKRAASVVLCLLLVGTMLLPGLSSFSANITLEITKDGEIVTERLEVQEDRTIQLDYTLSETAPAGSYVVWESNLPLLASVDDTGKVKGLDYSKAAVIQYWLDNDVRSMPLVGEATAKAIESALSGIDLETANTDVIVAIVSGINPTLGEALRKILENMNVEITATLYDASGNVLGSDTVEVQVKQSLLGTIAPTGVFITNKKSVPTTVAVGTTVQLHGAVTPVRLKQGIKWAMGSSALDRTSANYANVSSDGLVTFTAPGKATVRVNPESTLYAAFSDTITFTIVDPSALPVTDFTISGETTVTEGSTTQLTIDNLNPAGAYTGDLKWESDDPSIATIDQNGVVTGLDGGSGLTYSKTVTVRATIGDVTRTATITVKRNVINAIAGVEISGLTAVGIGNTAQYTATVSPVRLDSNRDVVKAWGIIDPVSNEKLYASATGEASTAIAKINNNGVLTGLSSGIATIYVDATYNGTTVTDQYEVHVGNAITDFSISGTNTVREGDTVQLSIVNIQPEDFDQVLLDTVVWQSQDPTIASVDQNGVVTGLDGGNALIGSTKTTVITATIGGITKEFTITVSRRTGLNRYTGGEIIGPDAVVVDFPYTYTATHTPERMDVYRQYWGIVDDNGGKPWASSPGALFGGSGNTENSFASVDNSSGLVSGKQAGSTTLWTYMKNNLTGTSWQDFSRDINIVELTPKSIAITAPKKYDYIEGETELDLEGLVVKLTYDRDELAQYYPEAKDWSEDKFTVEVTDYTVGEINPTLLDNEQYIVVTVTRAGKDMRGIFPILVHSKQVESIEVVTPPRYKYVEGETELDLAGLKVMAHYSEMTINNTVVQIPSEEITDYTVVTNDFDPTLFNVDQDIRVIYSHAGRSATTTFPVIIYGKPVVTVSVGDYEGGWTSKDVTFTLDATNQVEGITYYYRTASDTEWKVLTGNALTVSTNIEETYYFKAVNGVGIESDETIGYEVKIDKVVPVFELIPEVTDLTNQSYNVTINVSGIGDSGIASITLDGEDLEENRSFTVHQNGTYTVKITTVSGLESEQTIEIKNIDKDAPTVLSIDLKHKNTSDAARFFNTLTFGLFFKETVEITITAVDVGVAGIDRIEYRFLDENGDPIGDWEVYNDNNKPQQDPDFKGYIEARAIDKATNVSESLYSEGYVIDGTNPTDIKIEATDAGGLYVEDTWTSTDVTLKLSSWAFSDIYKYYYRTETDGEWIEMEGDTLVASTHGITNYEFKAESYAGRESEIVSFIVKIDKSVPVIRVDFEGTFGRWTAGNVVFNLSYSQLRENEKVISGVTYYYSTNNGADWTEIATGDEIVLNENINAYYIFKAVNGAGVESATSDSYHVMIDNVAPSIVFTPEVTEETPNPYDVAFNVTVGEAGLESVTVNGEDVTDLNKITIEENGKYVFVITGKNGLVTTVVLTIDNIISYEIEVTNISLTGVTSGGFANYIDEPFGKYFNESVEITIGAFCTDGALGDIQYRLLNENAEPTTDWLVYDSESKPTIDPNFKGYVEARAFDRSGNRMSETIRSEGITVDGTAPTAPVVTATVDGEEYTGEWTGKDIVVTLSSTAYSGILEYYYSVDGGEFIKITGNTVTLSDDGEHIYEFKAVSKAGLESETSTLGAKYEGAKPALSVDVDGNIGHRTSDDVKFTLSSPNTLSGVKYYYNNGSEWIELDGNTLLLDENCDTTYTFKAVNGAGVESYQSPYYRVIIDKSYILVEKKPILNVAVSGVTDAWTANPVTFKLSADELEGDVTYYYTTDGENWIAIAGDTLTVKNDGTATYKFKAVDSTDSKERESLESAEYTVKIDTVAPAASVYIDSTDFTNSERSATVIASAGISGIQSITVNGIDITAESAFKVTENGTYTVTVTANNGLSVTTTLTVASF